MGHGRTLRRAECTMHSSVQMVQGSCTVQQGALSGKLTESHLQSSCIPSVPCSSTVNAGRATWSQLPRRLARGTPLRTGRAALGLGTSLGPLPVPRPCSSHSEFKQGSPHHYWGHMDVTCRCVGWWSGLGLAFCFSWKIVTTWSCMWRDAQLWPLSTCSLGLSPWP